MRPLLLALSLVVAAAACSSAPETSANDAAEAARAPTPDPNDGESNASKERAKDPATALTVGVDAEPFASAGYNLTDLAIVVKVDGLVAASVGRSPSGALFPREVTVTAPADRRDADVEIDVAASMNTATIVTRKVRTRFEPGQAKLAYVYLEVRCNQMALLGGSGVSGPTCAETQTCVSGTCVSPEIAPSELPAYRADWTTSPPSACGDASIPSLSIANPSDGDTVTLERGPQCGHHFYVSMEMRDLSQFKTITMISGAIPGSSITIPVTAVPYAWSVAPSGKCELAQVRFQVDAPGTPIEELLGKPLDLQITANDNAGRSATVTRHLTIAETFSNPTGRPCY